MKIPTGYPNYCMACGWTLVQVDTSNNKHYLRCIHCGERYYNNPTVGVAVVHLLEIEGVTNILLGKRQSSYKNGQWCIPCGHLDSNEDVWEGAGREFQEETSLKALVLDLLDVQSNPNNTTGIYFLAKVVKGKLKANDDLSEVRYYPLDKNKLPDMAFKSDLDVIDKLINQ